MNDNKTFTFQVHHPRLGTVQVSAADKYGAIVAAAKAWKERWTLIASYCDVKELGPTVKTLCQRCKRVWVPSPGYCPQCAAIIRSQRREIDHMAHVNRQRRQEGRWTHNV